MELTKSGDRAVVVTLFSERFWMTDGFEFGPRIPQYEPDIHTRDTAVELPPITDADLEGGMKIRMWDPAPRGMCAYLVGGQVAVFEKGPPEIDGSFRIIGIGERDADDHRELELEPWPSGEELEA